MTVLLVLLRVIAEMYAIFGVLFFLLTLPNPLKRGDQ